MLLDWVNFCYVEGVSWILSSFNDDLKYHLMKWNIVEQLLPKGGLGIRDLIISMWPFLVMVVELHE